ncbi:MAG: aminodeoxychorismate/anthranilate synthase component II [Verrucomicrobiota bacterium]
MLLMIDNYDSFTYNLVQYLGELGAKMNVYRNDEIDVEGVRELNPARIVISPGPGTPDDAGISMKLIKVFGDEKPVLGVCLGHQSIAQVFGGKVIRAGRLMHGKTSPIEHDNEGVFKDLPNPFEATRYHSLIVEKESLPDCLKVTAQTSQGEIMGIVHREKPIHGVQFHPESILTREGKNLLQNFLNL